MQGETRRAPRGTSIPHGKSAPRGGARPFFGIHFDCCGVCARIYRNRAQTAYEGRCPRCLRKVRVAIAEDGGVGRLIRSG